VHNPAVLRTASSLADLEAMYGASNLPPSSSSPENPIPVKMITAAPELGAMTSLIPSLTARGIIVSVGPSEATYEEASAAVAEGATMITHLFNAMRPLQHRDPGIFGVLGQQHPLLSQQQQQQQHSRGVGQGQQQQQQRPYFGVIADGIHLHPATVKIAWHAHPEGFILVTDAMHMVGLPDGRYAWWNGDEEDYIVKKGWVLELEGSGAIAGR
jgi:N-acetylglucosamine-6-phosphate deacetylase